MRITEFRNYLYPTGIITIITKEILYENENRILRKGQEMDRTNETGNEKEKEYQQIGTGQKMDGLADVGNVGITLEDKGSN